MVCANDPGSMLTCFLGIIVIAKGCSAWSAIPDRLECRSEGGPAPYPSLIFPCLVSIYRSRWFVMLSTALSWLHSHGATAQKPDCDGPSVIRRKGDLRRCVVWHDLNRSVACRRGGCNCSYPDLTSFLGTFSSAACTRKGAAKAAPSSPCTACLPIANIGSDRPPSVTGQVEVAADKQPGKSAPSQALPAGSVDEEMDSKPAATSSSGTNTSVDLPDLNPGIHKEPSMEPQTVQQSRPDLPSGQDSPQSDAQNQAAANAAPGKQEADSQGPEGVCPAGQEQPTTARLAAKDASILADALKQVGVANALLSSQIIMQVITSKIMRQSGYFLPDTESHCLHLRLMSSRPQSKGDNIHPVSIGTFHLWPCTISSANLCVKSPYTRLTRLRQCKIMPNQHIPFKLEISASALTLRLTTWSMHKVHSMHPGFAM